MFKFILVILAYIFANLYWHKKIIVGRWEYTLYSTTIVILYAIFVLIS